MDSDAMHKAILDCMKEPVYSVWGHILICELGWVMGFSITERWGGRNGEPLENSV